MKFEGKVVVIAGGEGPLGRGVSQKFLKEGAKLVIGWNAPEEWKEAKELISGYKSQFVDVQFDSTNESDVEALMKKAKSVYGSIDILLHMVGMFTAGKRLWETDASTLDKLIEVNLKSGFLSAKHALKIMLEKGQGRIVFFPARLVIDPKPTMAAYSISKAGVITMIQALREELKDTKITVNGVMPDTIDTWKTRKIPNAEPEKWVTPAQIADVLSCVCSGEFDAVSGSIIKVFGKL
jgi:NAD(P)-dependent dehydrogenase (short-subunit alcohol dehydrogenase family)